MRDDLALAGVLCTIPDVEETTLDRNKGIVEVRLEGSGTVTINGVECIRVGDGNMVRGNSDNGTCIAWRERIRCLGVYVVLIKNYYLTYRICGGNRG